MNALRSFFSQQTPIFRSLFSQRSWEFRGSKKPQNIEIIGFLKDHSLLHIYKTIETWLCSLHGLCSEFAFGLLVTL
jgi:hypothetical protein